MVTVTQESLVARITELESGPRSLKEDFALEAYRMLLAATSQAKVLTNWEGAEYYTSSVEFNHCDGHEFGLAIDKLAKVLGVEING